MVGIAGIIDGTADTNRAQCLMEMLKPLTHRGKKPPKVHTTSKGVVGSVEMVESADYPVIEDGEPIVLLDGFLPEARQKGVSDAAFLEDQYRMLGKEAFSKLDGSFACVVVDQKEVILARDAVGARPLIYGTARDGTFYFASEAKALLNFVDTVRELPPAHLYSTREGLRPFVPFSPEVPDFESPEEAARILRELFIGAVERCMADGEVGGVALSGGLDSSITLAVAHEINPMIQAFSVSVQGAMEGDSRYARLVAQSLGVPLHEYELTKADITSIIPDAVWYLESFDEDCIAGFIANYYASRLASKFTNAVMVGEGADELFGGYFGELEEISGASERERVAKKLVDIAYNTALRRLDRGWLANSVDYRVPFLDSVIVAFSKKIPLNLKTCAPNGKPVEKWILREAFRDMLPEEIANRPKMRFARGVGVDDMIDAAVEGKVTEEEFVATPMTEGGLTLYSPKELYFYKLFRQYFPAGYEGLTVRWDPFK